MRLAPTLVALLALAWALLPSGAGANQLALVVGNDDYKEIPALSEGVNDARAMANALRQAGFVVELVENGTKRQMSRALAKVEAQIAPGDTVLFHYSGHGFEMDGQNWLLPIDVPSAKEGEAGLVKDESFNAADIIDRLRSKGAGTVVAFLDACRDNPFATSGTRSLGGTRGFARMEAPGGVFIMFSAGIKQEALDRLSPEDPTKSSVFVRSILPMIGRKDLSLIDMAKEVQARVRDLARSVGHDQVPAYYDGIVERVSLTGTVPVAPTPALTAATPPPPRGNAGEDLFWQSVVNSGNPAMFQAYLDQVKAGAFGGTYRTLAQIRLAALAAKSAAPATSSSSTPLQAALPVPLVPKPPIPAVQDSAATTACDQTAADPLDPEKPASITGIDLDGTTALAASARCAEATRQAAAPRRLFYQLARAYDRAGRDADALTAYRKAADLGHALALTALGERYLSGRGVARNGPVAMSMLVRAADAGNVAALVRIGQMYTNGLGVDRDYLKASVFFKAAIDNKAAGGYAEMGSLYLAGHGVAMDKQRACDMFKQGAAAGDPNAAEKQRSACGKS